MRPRLYDSFAEEAQVFERSRNKPYCDRSYTPIKCPHCHVVFKKIPSERVSIQKSSACKDHLIVCPAYNASTFTRAPPPPPPTADPLPKRQEQPEIEDRGLVTIYGLTFVPDNRIVYTGRTKDPDRRLAQHARRSSQCRLVRNAFKKHGRKSFRLDVLMRCRASDAKTNETAWIIKNNTLHPNGYNLMHGATAGEESDPDCQLVPSFTGVVPFEGEEEEIRAVSESWADVADVIEHGNIAEEQERQQEAAQQELSKQGVDTACRALLKQIPPDRAGEGRTFTATEVAALVNSVRARLV